MKFTHVRMYINKSTYVMVHLGRRFTYPPCVTVEDPVTYVRIMTNEFSHSVCLAVKASQITVDSHSLIYWPEEECVSITEITRVIDGKLAEGE